MNNIRGHRAQEMGSAVHAGAHTHQRRSGSEVWNKPVEPTFPRFVLRRSSRLIIHLASELAPGSRRLTFTFVWTNAGRMKPGDETKPMKRNCHHDGCNPSTTSR